MTDIVIGLFPPWAGPPNVASSNTKSPATTKKVNELTSTAILIKDNAITKTLCSTTTCVHTTSHVKR